MWIGPSVLAPSDVAVSRRGRLCVYPNTVIQMLLDFEQVSTCGCAHVLDEVPVLKIEFPNWIG